MRAWAPNICLHSCPIACMYFKLGPRPAHARSTGIANMAVVAVGPDNSLGDADAVFQGSDENEGLEHVRVAQVPRFVAPVARRTPYSVLRKSPVMLLGI